MIVCPKCHKENQDHYKFCLGCGAKLSAVAAPEPVAPPTESSPAARTPEVGRANAPAPEAAVPRPAPASSPVPPASSAHAPAAPEVPSPGAAATASPAPGVCPKCGTQNPEGFNFCGRCGTPLGAAPSQPAQAQPQPVVPPAAPAPAPVAAPPPGIVPPAGGAAAMPTAADVGSARTVFLSPDAAGGTAPGTVHAARLVMLGADGQPVGERLLQNEALKVGRDEGPPWTDDTYLDPEHATIVPAEGGVRVEDHGSLNGIFFRLEGRTEIRDGDCFRIGQELLRFEELPEPTPDEDGTEKMGSPNPGYWGRVVVLVDPDLPSAAWPFAAETVTLGREQGDITFPQDGYVSGTHARIVGTDAGIFLEDLDSSNGTYVRVRSGDVVGFGTTLLIGQRLFRIERP
ncbi:MAG: FHA domain-containing protein [Deltaproteobacteria bacterium]|nr:MAG: FHA domain-containing protein [Deltaproteobacteria bacterium]